MKHSLTVLGFALLCLTSCVKEKQSDPLLIITGQANSMQGAPAAESVAVGSISGIYNPINKKMAYNVTWANFSSVAKSAKFFIERDNQPDSLLFTLIIPEQRVFGNLGGHIFLNEQLTQWLLQQKWHYTITSATYAEGEIKGRIIVAQ